MTTGETKTADEWSSLFWDRFAGSHEDAATVLAGVFTDAIAATRAECDSLGVEDLEHADECAAVDAWKRKARAEIEESVRAEYDDATRATGRAEESRRLTIPRRTSWLPAANSSYPRGNGTASWI